MGDGVFSAWAAVRKMGLWIVCVTSIFLLVPESLMMVERER